MVEFRIDVVADPRPIEATGKRIARTLDKVEKEALQLRNALKQALSARDAGATTTLNKVNTALKESSTLAKGAKTAIEDIGGGPDPFAEQLASIRAQTEEIKLRNAAEGAIGQTLSVEASLRKQNRNLTAAETKELLTAVAQQRSLNDSIRQRAAIQKNLQSVQARTRDLEIQVLRVSDARKDALREANRLRSEGVKLTSRQVNQLEREFGKQRKLTAQIEASASAQNRLTSSTTTFGTVARRAFAGIGIALVVRQLAQLSDEFITIQNRLRTIIPDQNELNDTFGELVTIANTTRTELGSVVQLFQRGSLAAKELGASNAELLLFTERVGKALAVQGGSAASSSGALLQLSQALGSGIVRAEEFNSILEGAFPIAQAAARGIDGFGGSVSKLRGAIIKGTITSEVFFRGFLKGSEETAEQFEQTSSTIGQAFTVLGNNATVLVGKFNESSGAAGSLAEGILVLSRNLPQVAFAAGTLGTVLVVKYVFGANLATISTASLNKQLLLSVARFAGVAVVIAGTTAAVVLLANKINKFNTDLEEIGKTLNQVEKDSEFISSTAAVLGQNQRELNRLVGLTSLGVAGQNGEIIRANKLSESQLARIDFLRAAIARNKLALVGQSQAQKDSAAAAKETAAANEELANSVQRQKKLLEELNAPAKEFAQRQMDLNALLKQGRIDQDAFNAALGAKPEPGAAEADPFKTQLDSIQRVNNELEATAGLQGTLLRFTKEELALKEKGRELNILEQAQLFLAIGAQEVQLENEKRRQTLKKLNEGLAIREGELLIRAQFIDGARRDALIIANRLKGQGIVLDEAEVEALGNKLQRQRDLNAAIAQQQRVDQLAAQLDVTFQLAQAESDLLELRRQQPALTEEIDRALEELTLRQLDSSTAFEDGLSRAFIRLKQEAMDFAAVAESVVNVFADRATDALVEFAKTGQFNFKEFANAILDDLIRIIARLLIVQALSAVIGGGAGAVVGAGAGAVGGGRQGGGTVQPGQAPFPVNEAGQELFVPNRTGTIVPAPQAAPPPVVNVQLVTVQSEDMVAEAIASGSADEAIIQRIGSNRDRVNQAQG